MQTKPAGSFRLTLLFVLLFAVSLSQAQSYQALNNRIDSLVNIGLPKSALGEVDKLDALARREKNAPMQIKAVIYRMTFQSYIEENALVSIITRLKQDIDRATFPVKPVLQSLLADMYTRYYQQNRWQFNQRSRLEKPSEDFTKWDLQTIITETANLYNASLKDYKKEQSTPVDLLDDILKGDLNARYLRPTLYDLLLHRALAFFLADEPALTRPKDAFNINDPKLFGDSRTFASLSVMSSDTTSTFYQGIQYLQQATRFHLQQNNPEALADLDLKRLGFLYTKSTLANKDTLYTTALKQITKTFYTKPISADAWVALAAYEQSRNHLPQAMVCAKIALTAFPQSMGGHNAEVLISQITRKELTISTENHNIPGEPLLAQIQYRNVKTANITIYAMTEAQNKTYELKRAIQGKKSFQFFADFLKNLKPIQNKTLQLPDPKDYQSHRAEFKIDALNPGNYLIWIEDKQSADSTLVHTSNFKVSHLAYMSRQNPDAGLNIQVMDRKTGEPLKNVKVNLSFFSYANQLTEHENGQTDKTGVFIAHHENRMSTAVQLIFKDDTLTDNSKYINGAIKSYNNIDTPLDRTILFTDRQIYRPGQTIYFKGLQIQMYDGANTLRPNIDVPVDFMDANNKVVTTLKMHANEFGSFTGFFIIPQNILNGNVRLRTPYGQINVQVEEYKRKSFQASFFPVTESYKLNDSIKLKGMVKAFSGYGLSQARVAYHITRTQGYNGYYNTFGNYRYLPPVLTEIKTDTVKTNDLGTFQINFKAVPGEAADLNKIVYTYAVSISVTDGSGETYSTNTSVNVSNNNISINANLPTEYIASDTSRFEASIRNLNNQQQKGSIRMQIYALQSQSALVKNRLWAVPDQFLMSQNEFKAAFPNYAYRNEDDFKTWPQGKQISDVTLPVNDTTRSFLNLWSLKNQPSGMYLVMIKAQNEKGDTTSIPKYVNLMADHPMPVKIDRWVRPITNVVKPGIDAEFLVGIDEPINVLMERYKEDVLVSSQWLHLEKGQQSIKFPTTENETDFNVQFMMIYRNRAYSSYQTIQTIKPNKNLDIRMITFRNKLQPGEKEKWKLQVSGANNQKLAAEMVAGLYDASLDDLAPSQNWAGVLSPPRKYSPNYFSWETYSFIRPANAIALMNKYFSYRLQSHDYEVLNMFGYSYYGNYNNGYRKFQNWTSTHTGVYVFDSNQESNYLKVAALVKNGVDVIGTVRGNYDGQVLPGVVVKIKGTNIAVVTNSHGIFKIKVLVKGSLTFSSIGYDSQEINITKADTLNVTLNSNGPSLDEVVVVGYGTQKKSLTMDGSPVSISIADVQGSSSGMDIAEMRSKAQIPDNIMIRGNSTINSNPPLIVVDGVVMEAFDLKSIDPNDIENVQILKGAEAVALYGARAANGVMIITTKKGRSQNPITTRKNFNETAFFYPQLRTNEKGEILIDFTIPEALTQWHFKAFAHTQDLQSGFVEQMIVTQKQLSISANMPRFLREGDSITMSARLVNLSTAAHYVKVRIQLFNALTMQPVSLLVNPKEAEQGFNLAASTNKAVSFKLFIPAGLDALTYKLTADAGMYTDGEENTLPVLPNRMLVIESMPMMVRSGQERTFTLDKLFKQSSPTLKSKTLTLEYTQNPAWYAIQALPYMMEFPYECSEQIFSRYYANSMATNLVNKLPVIKQVFDAWKQANSPELLSNLEKNQELKAILLEETPWLRDAANETEQKKRIALLFDLNKMSYELGQSLDKLQKKQLPDGAFPWFGGDYPDRYITQHILEGIGQLYHLNIVDAKNKPLKEISDNALAYLGQTLKEEARSEKENKTYEDRNLWPMEIHSYFTLSYFPGAIAKADLQSLLDNYLKLAAKQWTSMNVYQQALVALTMQRNNKPEVAQQIIRSLNETAQHSEELGMYWAANQLGYYWYQSPIETQSLMIELFTEASSDTKAVEEMKIWLLRNKQTSNWKTTKATAAACYALLLKGDNWLEDKGTTEIKLGGKLLKELKPDVKADEGTGYVKTSWTDEQINPSWGKVTLKNNGRTMSYGALHWQYLENLDKITSSQTDIKLERKYFIQKESATGPVLTAIDPQHQPRTGDLLKVVVYLNAGRDFEYVQLKDLRPAGTEPVDVLSSFKFQDGLYYYQVTKDVATNFFISRLNKGSFVFEYRLRVVQPGNYSTGITTVQSMYAPEFNAHSEGARMIIR